VSEDLIVQGSRWTFHNATTGGVTEYVLDTFEPPETRGRMAWLLNPETEKYAVVSVRWLLGQANYPSKWRPVGP
jgi:hypothetical protein